MMPVRWMPCMLVLFLSCFGARTHDGHTHVVGTVTTMSDGQLVVNNKNGQTMAIQVDRHTWYHPISVATSSWIVRVGNREIVEVTEAASGLGAAAARMRQMLRRDLRDRREMCDLKFEVQKSSHPCRSRVPT